MNLRPEIMFRFFPLFLLLGIVVWSGSTSSGDDIAPGTLLSLAVTAATPADSSVMGLVPVSAGLF
jgi:hypothetical protein